jgi:hypothetical protein
MAYLCLVRRISCHFVKSAFLAFLLVASPWAALADDSSYHAEITDIRRRYLALENRKVMGSSLSPAEEKERLCLLGQLIDQDPVSALTRDIVADVHALEGSGKPEEHATAEKLVELSAITTGFEGRATTLAEAKSFASILRKFVVRRDVEGAKAWAKAQ